MRGLHRRIFAMQSHVDTATILRTAAMCAHQAPSTHNTQPWRLRIRGGALEVAYDEHRRLGAIDPLGRQMVMSCGCALYNARVAIRAAGFVDETQLFPDPKRPELLAITRPALLRAPADLDRALLAAIPRRHTYRRPFRPLPVPASLADLLAQVARAERTRLYRLSPPQKLQMGELVAELRLRRHADPAYRAEVRRARPCARKEYAGAYEPDRINAAPLIAVMSTEADEPIDWLDCGQALEAVLLRATSLGLATSYLNQVLEVQDLAEAVDRMVAPDLNAQMILRIGWPERDGQPASRRALDDVLLED